MGSKSYVSMILSGKKPLTLDLARIFHKESNIPVDILLSHIKWINQPAVERPIADATETEHVCRIPGLHLTDDNQKNNIGASAPIFDTLLILIL